MLMFAKLIKKRQKHSRLAKKHLLKIKLSTYLPAPVIYNAYYFPYLGNHFDRNFLIGNFGIV